MGTSRDWWAPWVISGHLPWGKRGRFAPGPPTSLPRQGPTGPDRAEPVADGAEHETAQPARHEARSRDDLRGLRDLLGVRQILETELTRQVARQPDESLLADLDACVARMHDPATSADADRQFHERIGAAAGNDLALELIRVFWDVYRQTESLLGTPVSPPKALVAKHQLIVDTIRAGEPESVADAVSHHFDEIRDRIAALRR
jgi:DNA-binding FadR family transcriptional regulator